MNPTNLTKMIAAALMTTAITTATPSVAAIERAPSVRVTNQTTPDGRQSIMIALLLDTSNSMDGLIDQAKSQLWKIVNELASARCNDDSRPRIKIALYEYGNSGLPATLGYIRQVSPLTDDLDLLSEKLFSLRTNGGNEYCGQVIKTSLDELEWSNARADLKMIFIAGNEPFTQGEIPYRKACSLANEKDVVVNTIFCGPYSEGIETEWKTGASLTGGTYMSIEQDRKTVYIATPYDERIDALNNKLNDTYVYYGSSGAAKKEMQVMQDNNASSYGAENKAERSLSKSKSVYSNEQWDLVDAAKADDKVISKAKDEELPPAMRGMTVEQRKAYVAKKSGERAAIQKEMQELGKKRQEYIQAHMTAEQKETMLDAALLKAIKEKGRTKNLSWE